MVFHTKVQRSSLNARNFAYRVSPPIFDTEPKFDELDYSEGYDVFTWRLISTFFLTDNSRTYLSAYRVTIRVSEKGAIRKKSALGYVGEVTRDSAEKLRFRRSFWQAWSLFWFRTKKAMQLWTVADSKERPEKEVLNSSLVYICTHCQICSSSLGLRCITPLISKIFSNYFTLLNLIWLKGDRLNTTSLKEGLTTESSTSLSFLRTRPCCKLDHTYNLVGLFSRRRKDDWDK